MIESWCGYDTVIDVGCGEGWYVVGLARRLPAATVHGFDISAEARRACEEAIRLNNVTNAHVHGEVTAFRLSSWVEGRTLIIMDVDTAEVELLDPDAAPRLKDADVLLETHDDWRPGITEIMRKRFADRDIGSYVIRPRDAAEYPALASLSHSDQERALDESRPPNQTWLWMPRS